MLRGLWKLTWLEIKIFLREPLGAVGSILFPVVIFVVVSRLTCSSLPIRPFLFRNARRARKATAMTRTPITPATFTDRHRGAIDGC